ncbi:ABC transporter ATP-binding protein [Thermicanus aegyptius]|uniref:ABC transporter ATP-binding protein n=1 Tax=Thermicanus aegyptius TaxID=94009 RepID=UPI0004016808|nr:ABC transporter ATP-binding protein [Thermicanus aegyptius]
MTIEVRDLCKVFPVKGSRDGLVAVDGVSFRIDFGETLGLVGESGSGKTTVGRCILRLLEPTSGQILFDGRDITRLKQHELRHLRSQMQMVFQDPFRSLNPRMSIGASIAEPMLLQGMGKEQSWKRAAELIQKVGLKAEDLDLFPYQLGGGELQRVGIARAIATNPKFIVLDEPTSLLDLTVRTDILQLLVSLQREMGLAYLLITHDLSTVRDICHRVAVMYLGQIVEMGDVQQVFGNPCHPYSRALLSSVLVPDPRVRRSGYTLKGEIPSPLHVPHGCYLHTRCPEATDRCCSTRQQLLPADGKRLVRCWQVTAPADEETLANNQEGGLFVETS